MKNANIKNFRVHDLRHTAASMAISHGHSEAAIAKMLGHKSTAMIKHYDHLANKPEFDVADTLSELINFKIKKFNFLLLDLTEWRNIIIIAIVNSI